MPSKIKRVTVPHDDPFEKLIPGKIGAPSRNDAALKPVPMGLRGRPPTWLTRAPKGGRGIVSQAPQADARRRVVAKLRYWNKYGRGASHASKINGLGRYLGRLKDDGVFIDEAGHSDYLARESPFFSERSDHLSAAEVTKAAANDHRTFELILNPYDGDRLVSREFIRTYMSEIEKATGTRLAWFSVIHEASTVATQDNRHAHILIRGKDLYGREIKFAPGFVKEGFRRIAEDMATSRLGPMTERELERYREVREWNRERAAELRRMDREGVSMGRKRAYSKEWKERRLHERGRENEGRTL